MPCFLLLLQHYKNELDNLQSMEEVQPRIRDLNDRLRDVDQEIRRIQEQQSSLRSERQPHEEAIRRASDELTQMNDVRNQRLTSLRMLNRDAHSAVVWLKDNGDKFAMPILEPVMLSVNIVDRQYVNQVEAFLSGKDFMSFIAQSEEDKEMFLKEVHSNKLCTYIHECV